MTMSQRYNPVSERLLSRRGGVLQYGCMSARRWIRVTLLSAVATLSVAGTVASNQILNNGVWTWWLTLIAVPLAGTVAGLTLLMSTNRTTQAAVPKGPEAPAEAHRPEGAERPRRTSQVVRDVTTSSSIIQISDVGGDVEVRGS